jgi:polyhydroxybutyrate depolymerase
MRRFAIVLVALALTAGLASLAQTPAQAQVRAGDPAASCSLKPTGGTVTKTIEGGGGRYLVNVPSGLTATEVPLLISLHGFGSTVESYETTPLLSPGWTAYAAKKKFIVAYPQGPNNAWRDVGEGSPNVAYIRSVVAAISKTYCIDADRIYADGHSNGAAMALRLACDAADLFAAVAEYAGNDPTLPNPPEVPATDCTPSRPISVGLFHGLLDPLASYPVAVHARDLWLKRNGCPTTGTTEPGVLFQAIRYAPCRNNTEVVFRVTLQSHNWPTGAAGEDQRNRIWAQFERNPMP